ncbi:hypothetical protein OIN60_10170 [Paenibacillus sp. P96]|uniref:Uncharacterized protein n=1 Tax=Paenibacillus zeirhizosphaerae TaxID=2987519 RepID=A0ABT9FR36_9BACL|nr:hypothetical protein [Paenibacillus sp. P96]MDP4097134.1 hypothetical protein [Paenibacillus sp. P96]
MKRLLIASTMMASLALTSTAAFAMATEPATGGPQSTSKETGGLQSANKETQSRIEYTKEISYLDDGSVNAVVETWVDPVTHDKRIDMMAKEEDGTIHPISQYLKENGTKWVEVARDKNGKAISGKYYKLSEKEKLSVDTWTSFADSKAEFAKTGWKHEGLLEAQDGKKLIKLSGQNMLEDDIQPEGSKVVINEYAQLDEATGLPVKLEAYSEYKGIKTQQYSVAYEHKYVDDKSLFDTTGIPMKQYSKLQWIHGVEY